MIVNRRPTPPLGNLTQSEWAWLIKYQLAIKAEDEEWQAAEEFEEGANEWACEAADRARQYQEAEKPSNRKAGQNIGVEETVLVLEASLPKEREEQVSEALEESDWDDETDNELDEEPDDELAQRLEAWNNADDDLYPRSHAILGETALYCALDNKCSEVQKSYLRALGEGRIRLTTKALRRRKAT